MTRRKRANEGKECQRREQTALQHPFSFFPIGIKVPAKGLFHSLVSSAGKLALDQAPEAAFSALLYKWFATYNCLCSEFCQSAQLPSFTV